jgi:hypothetical protein
MRRAVTLLGGGLAYLLAGVVAWWHVWSGGVSHTITAQGWGDPAQQVWYLGWVPHALGTGVDPFISHAMFAPGGINLMANTSILFPSLLMSPVSAIWGPLVAFNVLVVLAPALSAFAAWRVFARSTTFEGGAWLAGLFFGYSPFVLNDLADGHLHVTLLVFVPLVLALVDDIAVSQRGSPIAKGVLLGLVIVGQALTSLEVLAMLAIMTVLGLGALAIWFRSAVRQRLRGSLEGFGAAALTAAVLLAWPAWVLFRGPRRYRGTVFRSPESYVVWLKALVWPRGGGALPHEWAAYIGIPLLLLLLAAAVAFKSAVLRFSIVMALIALVFAMGRTMHVTPGISTHVPLPDRVVTRAPFLEDLLPVRFMIVIDLFVGLGLAVALGQVRERWLARRPSADRSGLVTAGAFGLGVLVLVSPALGAQWPYPARQVAVPAVYRSPLISHLGSKSILLAYPVMNGFVADPMIWQAETAYPYEMVAGYGFIPGPGPHPLGSLPPSPVTDLFGEAQSGCWGPPYCRVPSDRAVRAEMRAWHVDTIVVLPKGKDYRRLVGVLRRLLGRSPDQLDGAYVWTGLRGLGGPTHVAGS